jgi:hypothetical protein
MANKIMNLTTYNLLLKKVFDNKKNEFVMYTKSAVYMSVNMYPMTLCKKVTQNGTEYSTAWYTSVTN